VSASKIVTMAGAEKVLITGGQGFFGAHIAKQLFNEGGIPIIFDLKQDDGILKQVITHSTINASAQVCICAWRRLCMHVAHFLRHALKRRQACILFPLLLPCARALDTQPVTLFSCAFVLNLFLALLGRPLWL